MFCGINSYNTCSNTVFGLVTAPQPICHLFIALPMICCSRSAQKSAVQVYDVCRVGTVVMETTQLVQSQLKNFLS